MNLPDKLSRREALGLGLGTLLSLGLWPGRLFAETPAPEVAFTFIAVNDLHYREAACTPWFERVVKAMKASAPGVEFCLVGGDLSDENSKFLCMSLSATTTTSPRATALHGRSSFQGKRITPSSIGAGSSSGSTPLKLTRHPTRGSALRLWPGSTPIFQSSTLASQRLSSLISRSDRASPTDPSMRMNCLFASCPSIYTPLSAATGTALANGRSAAPPLPPTAAAPACAPITTARK